MEIVEIKAKDPTTLKKQLCASLTSSQLKDRCPDEDSFLEEFAPIKQINIVANVFDCIFGAYPTLAQVNKVYEKKIAQKWLVDQLCNMSDYLGYDVSLNEDQIKELPVHIFMKYHWMKISELMLFFWLFKEEAFGNHYGRIEPAAITSALRDFVGEDGYRSKKIREIMQSIEEKYYELHDQHVDNSRDFLKEMQGVLASKFTNSSEIKEE